MGQSFAGETFYNHWPRHSVPPVPATDPSKRANRCRRTWRACSTVVCSYYVVRNLPELPRDGSRPPQDARWTDLMNRNPSLRRELLVDRRRALQGTALVGAAALMPSRMADSQVAAKATPMSVTDKANNRAGHGGTGSQT
jgi:hypothetical protein